MNATAEERFVRRLEKLAALERAALKAEAGRPPRPDVAAFDAFTAVFWPLPNSRLPRDACRLVAALYFWHPMKGGRGDLGTALRRAAGRNRLARTDRLLEQLLAAPLSGLHGPLFEAVRRLAAARVPVDWPPLIADLRDWDRSAEPSVQHIWAESWLQQGDRNAD
jgi:CRISPR type I-E-associated protein CasB/Cse2